jgi:arginine utilization regulatory protein
LEHAIEQAMNILPDDLSVITPDYIPDHILNSVTLPLDGACKLQEKNTDSLSSLKQNTEFQILRNALLENGGNISKTARSLEISRQNLQYRLKRSGIDVKSLLNK